MGDRQLLSRPKRVLGRNGLRGDVSRSPFIETRYQVGDPVEVCSPHRHHGKVGVIREIRKDGMHILVELPGDTCWVPVFSVAYCPTPEMILSRADRLKQAWLTAFRDKDRERDFYDGQVA